MVDVFSREKRSEIMSKIRSKNTQIELIFRKILWSLGIMYRLYSNKLPGMPDLVIKKYKTVVFIDGCYWHGCPAHFKQPNSNKAYWGEKIKNNKLRDKKITKSLEGMGWRVIRVWEHTIKLDPVKSANRTKKLILSSWS